MEKRWIISSSAFSVALDVLDLGTLMQPSREGFFCPIMSAAFCIRVSPGEVEASHYENGTGASHKASYCLN